MQNGYSHAWTDASLAVSEALGVLVMRGTGDIAVPRPRFLPAGVPWNRTTPGEVFYGLQVDRSGIVEQLSLTLAAALPGQWQALLGTTQRRTPPGILMGSGVLPSGAAFVDYDADALQWVGAWTIGREHRIGHRRPTLTCQPRATRQERVRGRQRAYVSLLPVDFR